VNSELNTTLLAKFLAEECDNSEKQLVSEWLSKSSKNRETMKEFEKLWEASGHSDFSEDVFDSNLEWVVLQHRIEDETLNFNKKSVNRSTWLSLYNPILPTLSKVAALFLVAAVVGLFFIDRFYVEEVQPVEPAFNEISMDKGYRGGVTLSDGTKVYINSDSKIIIPKVFKSNKREVFLEGEAFFEVAKNPNKPFLIRTKGAIVEVLGTSFAVRNYPGDNIIQTVVSEGTVSFSSDNKSINNGVILTAGNLGRLNLDNNEIKTEHVSDIDFYLSWKDGYLTFQNEKMKEVAKQLERKYDIEVVFDSKEIADMKLTAELRSRSLVRVLETISMSLKIDYTLLHDRVSFELPDDLE
jgi:ferric-dicitrate binding protein FerR (iron transport regulator)|tara:strand:- start:5673 stop:6734 length:1062 start_codon:yes stop_codon:yes gene_type:complete